MRAVLSVAICLGLSSVVAAGDAKPPHGQPITVTATCTVLVVAPGTPQPGPDGWIQLFNGKDLTGWQDGAGKPATKWKVDSGTIQWQKGCGNLWTVGRYGDFILDLEFNIVKRTNSGVFLRCDKLRDWLNTCFEIQILDTVGEKRLGKHDCGSLYDIQGPTGSRSSRPANGTITSSPSAAISCRWSSMTSKCWT